MKYRIINQEQFAEFAKTIYCLSLKDFTAIYGDDLGNNIFNKLKSKGMNFIFDIDIENLLLLWVYVHGKIDKRQKPNLFYKGKNEKNN